jgi:hypothetical protein
LPSDTSCPACSLVVPIARFASITDPKPIADTAPWSATRRLLSEHKELPAKGGPLWSPAVYAVGSARSNDGVLDLTAFVADIDDGTDVKTVQARLASLGLEYLIHSTHSSTPKRPKYRVVVPLSAPVPVAAWPHRWAQLNALLVEEHSDRSTKDPSRAFYLPSHAPGAIPFVYAGHGKPFDIGALVAVPDEPEPPLGTPAAPDFGFVSTLDALLTRVAGGSPEGPLFRHLLETTRGEPRTHETNLAIAWVLFKAGATVPQISRLVDWPESNVQSTLKRFRAKGAYSFRLERLVADDPLVRQARGSLLPSSDAEAGNPWAGREGWDDEPLLPILMKQVSGEDGGRSRRRGGDDDEDGPVEWGYVLYNSLVKQDHFRPFRTYSGEPRVAIPTSHGLEILNPAANDFVTRIGYQLFSIKGQKVPSGNLRVATDTLTSRALSRSLPRSRVLELWLRVAPAEPLCARIDMFDEARRCIHVGPDGWTIEDVGHPIFDSRHHMLPLPVPNRAGGAAGDWTRVNRLWKYVLLPESDGIRDQRLLALADLVQLVLAPASPKTVKVLAAEEGTGKSGMMERYQAVLDPSIVPHMKPPAAKDDDNAMNIAVNRCVVNFDNVSSISAELSDYLCRISSGTGLVKRKLYSDSEETVVTVYRSVLINGITAVPRMADLLRRALFFNPAKPRAILSREVLALEWAADHPDVLGGLLDLCVLVARVLRDKRLPPESSSMADYVRIGQAVEVAIELPTGTFMAAWQQNVDVQNNAAAQDPYVGALFDYFSRFTPASPAVRAEAIAAELNVRYRDAFPKGINPQQIGNAIARCKRTLEHMGVCIGRKVDHGLSVYYRRDTPDGQETLENSEKGFGGPSGPSGPPSEPPSSSALQGSRDGGVVALQNLGGPPPREVHPGPSRTAGLGGPENEVHPGSSRGPPSNFTSEDSNSGGPEDPLSSKQRVEGKATGLPEESNVGRSATADRVAAWLRDHPQEAQNGPFVDPKDFIVYPDGTVCDSRITALRGPPGSDIVWRPGDDPAKRPLFPPEKDWTPPKRRRRP